MKNSTFFGLFTPEQFSLGNAEPAPIDAVNAEITLVKNKPVNFGVSFPEADLPIHSIVAMGTPGNDTLNGTNANDTLFGNGGDDVLNGYGGEDVLEGGDGNDIVFGDSYDDTLYGNDHNDTLFGGDGIDWLQGGDGERNFLRHGPLYA